MKIESLKSRIFFLLSVFVLATGAFAQTATSNLTVAIVNPTNDSVFYTPTNILLIAKVSDPVGSVSNVEFFAGTNDLGPGEPIVLDPPGVNGVTGLVYLFDWTNPPVGAVALTAVATDNSGVSAVSPAVNITVLQGPPPPAFPTIRIVSPPNGSVFYAPVDIPLFAYINGVNPFYYTESVVFYDGTNIIGAGQPIPSPVPVATGGASNSVPPIYPTNLFTLVWSNAPVGNHVLTAHALVAGKIDMIAFMIVSPPVDITVLPPQPPPTNRPAIVDIVATDPIAVESTNSWVWSGETNSPPTWSAWPAATAACCYFTNIGPKTATFTVRRCGETNDDLTVTYSIGGTASNGVDYVALPGYVTIPAGERRAFINIVPIDDDISPAVIKTVILTLTPSTNVPPDYLVGFPPRAAAIIIDSPRICPVATMTPDQCFRLSMPGPDAAWFCVQRSTDFINWTPVCTNQVVNGRIEFIDPDASGNVKQSYRIVPISSAPAE